MMRSLFSGISGLKTHQTRMDVIGNNIANVNTVAYKSSSATFSELMYQTSQRASGPNSDTGRAGQNAKQIGLGVKLGAINTNIAAEGSTQSTGNPWDIRVNGDAFFIVSQGNGSPNYFTRDGALYVDAQGNLAQASTGYNVMGWLADPDNPSKVKQEKVQPLKVMSPAYQQYDAEATTRGYLSGILDENDENIKTTAGKSVNMSFYDQKGYMYTAKFSFHEAMDTAKPPKAIDGQYTLRLDDIVNSNNESLKEVYGVDDISKIAQIGVGDKAGATVNDANGKPTTAVTVQYNTGTGKLEYVDNSAGTGTENNFNITFQPGGPDLSNFKNIKVDMSNTTNVSHDNTSTISATNGAPANNKDGEAEGFGSGRKVGDLQSLSIDTSGRIYATYTNSQQRLIGQIAVARFSNPSGLEKMGDNLYNSTMNSGSFDGVGQDITADGKSNIATGVLEMSNVDLSSEFTEMITTQRGFQANSRIITVSDTLLEELVNLKR